MKETVQIDDFLKTGHFGKNGEIQYGMNRQFFIQLLGESKWTMKSRKSSHPEIYKYDKVEFYFEKGEHGRLFGIQIKPSINSAPLLKLRIDYHFIDPNLQFENSIECLKSNAIEFDLINFKYDDENAPQRILTSGNVELIFDDGLILEKVSKFVELPKTEL